MATPDLQVDPQQQLARRHAALRVDMAWIAGGDFLMGSDRHYAEERPAHWVSVDGFWMDRYAVTNQEFAAFVADTGYVTLAERVPDAADYPGVKPELLRAASVVFERPPHGSEPRNPYDCWRYVADADWRHPLGRGRGPECHPRHPAVHIACEDAEAYARWAGKDLPTEAEWELAARGGLEGAEYAWGDELMPGGRAMANTWQGSFPEENLLIDGYEGTAPVGSFPPNGYGLYDMIGNVWEWTGDWYVEHWKNAGGASDQVNPRGGTWEQSMDPRSPEFRVGRKVVKGGSYLCAPGYSRRYRPAARMAQPVDIATCHVGFRCVVRGGRHPVPRSNALRPPPP